MTQSQIDPQAQPALRITVTEASTIYSGAVQLQRFDAPAPRDIAAYVRTIFGPDPAGVHVHITATEPLLREFEEALGAYEVVLTTEVLSALPVVPAVPPGGPTTDVFDLPERPRDDARGATWVVVAVVALAVVACLAAVVFTARSLFGGSNTASTAAPVPTPTAALDAETSTQAHTSPPTSAPAQPDTVTLERAGVTIELPAGFTLERDGEMWRAAGGDPDFRLQVAVEELYNLPEQAMLQQLLSEVDTSEDLDMVDTDGHSLTYREQPGDGSEVLWKTWPQDNHQIFLGCHTRTEPTTVQQATCRLAMDSATFDAEQFAAEKLPSQQVTEEEGVDAMGG